MRAATGSARRRHAGLGLVAAVLVMGASFLTAPAARAESVLLRLIDQPAWVRTKQPFSIRVRITDAPPAGSLSVELRSRSLTRLAFLDSLDGKTLGRRLGSEVTVPVVGDGDITVEVPTTSLPTEGVYPVVVTLRDAGGVSIGSFVTHVTRLPEQRSIIPLGVAVVLRLGRDAVQVDGEGRRSLSEASRTETNGLISVLQRRSSAPVTLSVLPEFVDALPEADSTLAALRQATGADQVLRTPYTDLDVSAWLAAGRGEDLSAQFTQGAETLGRLGRPLSSTAFSDFALDEDALRWLRDHGASRALASDARFEPLDERYFNRTLTQPFQITGAEGLTAVSADDLLVTHLGESGDPRLDAQRVLSDLSVIYFDEPPATRLVVFAPPVESDVPISFLDALLRGLVADPILRPGSLDDLMNEVPLAGARGASDGSPPPLTRDLVPTVATLNTERLGIIDELRQDSQTYSGFAGATEGAVLQRLSLLAGSGSRTDGEASRLLDAGRSFLTAGLATMELPRRQTLTFTARTGTVSLNVHSAASEPVHVVLEARGARLRLPAHPDGRIALTLNPGTNRVEFSVNTLTSGDSALSVILRTPDERVEIGRTQVTVRSTALSGVGVLLSIGALLVLGAWWIRTVLAARRSGRSSPNAAP